MSTAPIYIVGAVDVQEGRTTSRAEEAVGCMERDSLFFEDGHYTHGLIERYYPGDGTALEAWYAPVYPDGNRRQPHASVVSCDKPAAAARVCNFFLG